jgi:hypothetical protein
MIEQFDMAAAALEYARDGWHIFPCWPILPMLPPQTGFMCGCGKLACENPGKHPMGRLVPKGFLNASADASAINHWWTARPDANIGFATGGLVVLDVDPRHGGEKSLAELERNHGILPATRRARTGGGGWHFYFKSPPTTKIASKVGVPGCGLDIRAHGGYVLIPPSRHVSGNSYTWDDTVSIYAAMPDWLVAAARQPQTAKPAATWRNLAASDVSEGKRNDTVARFAGHLLRRYVDPHVVLELLLTWDAVRCKPSLGRDEVICIVNSIARKEVNRRQAE